jgi:hypothetical protein
MAKSTNGNRSRECLTKITHMQTQAKTTRAYISRNFREPTLPNNKCPVKLDYAAKHLSWLSTIRCTRAPATVKILVARGRNLCLAAIIRAASRAYKAAEKVEKAKMHHISD